MKQIILAIVILAVVGIIAYKALNKSEQLQPQATPTVALPITKAPTNNQSKPIFYLFHDASDQDAGCRRIYAYADRAEKELVDKVEVRRPDIEHEKQLVDKFQVRVLPTILLVSPTGTVEQRFEGEDNETAKGIEQTLEKLKGTAQ